MTVSRSLSSEAFETLSRLEAVLRGLAGQPFFALAYSGGLDSRFLAFAARHLGFHPLLLHVCGPHVAADETACARNWARSENLLYEEVSVNPLTLPLVASGDRRRCYACKRELFSRLQQRTQHPLCDGTNASDMTGYRPGLQAIRELGVVSPLALVGLDKPAIHRLAAEMGMAQPDQKPRPCLLTRLPYGMAPKAFLLAALERGERTVFRVLAEEGFPDMAFRLRMVAVNRPELHVTRAGGERLSQEVRRRLVEELKRTVPELPPVSLVLLDTLSGFFDRTDSR